MTQVMDRPAVDSDDGEPPMFGLGDWVVSRRRLMDRSEEPWLRGLAAFDRSEDWRADGQLSCVDWLKWRTGMCRTTAFEKLRVAHQLERRPVVAEALRHGDISYSATRAITRLDDPGREVDEALVRLAKTGPVEALEQAIRYYQALEKQESLPDHLRRYDRRGLHFHRQFNGLGAIEIVLDAVELAEVAATLEAFMNSAQPVDEYPAGDDPATEPTDGAAEAVDEYPAGDDPADPAGGESSVEFVPYWERRLDAFLDMVRTALAHAQDGHAVGADRYMVHAVVDTSSPSAPSGDGVAHLVDGTILTADVIGRMACDASTVVHHTDGAEPLNLGRRTRVWSMAQRRAVTVRDGGRCRFPGCQLTRGDIHHLRPWEKGGPTDVANAAYVCTRHHTLLHQGFDATGDPNHELAFHRPDGSVLGTSAPRRRGQALLFDSGQH